MSGRNPDKFSAELPTLKMNLGGVLSPPWERFPTYERWPWTYGETPENAARYWTRDLAFRSRQVAALRSDPAWAVPPIPDAWQPCAAPMVTGDASPLDLRRGSAEACCRWPACWRRGT